MKAIKMQQIIVSGVGGQGVLFVTRVLAETAMDLGYSILLSETHGMAQRGGNVISHLKVSSRDSDKKFTSPLIRPGRADILLGLHADSMKAHGYFLRPGAPAYCNLEGASDADSLDATAVAAELGSPISANLVLLGFAAASGELFCTPNDLAATLQRIGGKRVELSLKAFEAGRQKRVA